MGSIAGVLAVFTELLTWLFTEALGLVFTFIIANPIVCVALFMSWIFAMVIGIALSLFSPGRG